MATTTNILYEKKRRGVQITLNRPHVLNALSEELLDELDSALEEARKDPEIRAVVLTGAGGNFSSGEDLSADTRAIAWPYGIPENSSLVYEYDKIRDQDRKSFLERQLYRWEYPKPIIGAVGGWCLGAASWLALTCHLTFAADDAVFGQPQIRHASGTDFIWVMLAGFKNALRYSLTGDHIDAEEALRIGLVNHVTEPAELISTCEALAKKIIANAPLAVQFAMEAVEHGMEMTQEKGLFLEATLFGVCCSTDDMREGTRAFLEKRAAQFKGR